MDICTIKLKSRNIKYSRKTPKNNFGLAIEKFSSESKFKETKIRTLKNIYKAETI